MDPFMNFVDFGLAENLLKAVYNEGYTDPTPIQAQAIPAIMSGRDVIGCAQTGTGKTAAFALPILQKLMTNAGPKKAAARKLRVLVLASTRELASQIRDSFETYGACTSTRVTAIYGGVGQGSQVRALGHGLDVLVATPGRLLDLMGQGYVNLEQIDTLILDEADRMLDMGFLPAIRQILEWVPTKRQTLLFSATMPAPIVQLAGSILRNPIHISIEPEKKAVDSVKQTVCMVPQKQKIHLLIQMLKEIKPERAIVFTRTKHGAERIVRELIASDIKSDSMHSNKSQNKRLRVLAEFKRDNPPVLVATDIAARGIDVDNISHVFNFEIPNEPDTYVHRIGRSGRAGASGDAISFCDSEERKYLRDIEQLIGRRLQVTTTIEGPATSSDESRPSRHSQSDRRSGPGKKSNYSSSKGGGSKGGGYKSGSSKSASSKGGAGRSSSFKSSYGASKGAKPGAKKHTTKKRVAKPSAFKPA
jgi:ATP-dependent RNA helicase RhlE